MKRIPTAEAAAILGVEPETVRDYAAKGQLWSQSWDGQKGPGKRRYFNEGEVRAAKVGGMLAAKSYRESHPDEYGEAAIPVRKGRGKRQPVA